MQLIFLLRFLAGASFAGPLFGASLSLWAGAALWACVTLAVYVFNGAMDVEEDRVNGSNRPVARGKLRASQAVGAAAALATAAIVGGVLLNGFVACGAAATLALGWSYSGPPFYLKRYPAGLAATAVLAGLLTYLAGYAATGGAGDHYDMVLFCGVMASWMGFVGQTKDLSDVEGDERVGRRSMPVVWGEARARLAYAAVALFLGGTFLVRAATSASDLLLPSIILALGAAIVAALLLGPWSRGCKSKRRRPYRAFMATQYAVHLFIIMAPFLLVGGGDETIGGGVAHLYARGS